jgi:hypothetical protein
LVFFRLLSAPGGRNRSALLKHTEPDTDRQANAWRFFFAGPMADIHPA